MLTMEQQHFDDARRNIVDRCEQDSWTISQQERQAALAVLFLKFQSLDSNVAMTWQLGTLQKSIMTILTLTPTLLDEILDRSSALSLLVSIQSASSLLQSVTHQLILCRPKKHSMKRSSNDVIRWETRTIVDIVQTVESLVTGGIMLNDHQLHAINESLVAHAHQLVDALLAFLNPSLHRLGSDQFTAQGASPSSAADADSPAAGKRLLRGILPLKNQPMGSNSTRTHTKHVVDDSDDDSTSLLSNSTKSSKSVHVFKKFLFGHHRKHQQQRIKESVFHKRTKRHSGCTVNSSCSLGSSNSNSSTRSNPTVSARWSRESSLGGELQSTTSIQQQQQQQQQTPASSSSSPKSRRLSVQTLSSPSSRRTYIRMADNYCQQHLEAEENGDLTRTGYNQAENRLDESSDRFIPSDSCYFSVSSSSQASFKTAIIEEASTTRTTAATTTTSTTKHGPSSPFQTMHSRDNLVSIHIEHAEPTFISTSRREPSSTSTARKGFLRVRHPSNEGSLKHHRSESDLNRLKNLFTHHPGSNSSATTISSTLRTLIPSRSNSIKLTPSMSNSRSCQTNSTDQSAWGHIVRNLRRNPSSLSLNKKANEDDEILKQAGISCSNHPPSLTKNQHCEGSILHVSENGQDVLVMEMVGGKLHVTAGTCEKLFLKLADETAQDLDYVDTYIMSHHYFTTSTEFLENLMARFHLEAQPGEAEYFKKWQRCIQVKVLNVITRWIKLQYQDFEVMPILKTRLEAFLNGDIKRAGFSTEAHTIREALDLQAARHARRRHSLVALTSSHSKPCTVANTSPSPFLPPTPSSIVSPRRPAYATTPASSIISPPSSPTSPSTFSIASVLTTSSPLLTFDSKDVAKYLTLADFYIFKCITAYDYLHGPWRQSTPSEQEQAKERRGIDYIAMMIQRANTLNRWVDYELANARQSKRQKIILKKLIEIAKFCLEWNNFHTSMIITMGLIYSSSSNNNNGSSNCPQSSSSSKQALQEHLSYKDSVTLGQLKKNLDVGNNMAAYRQAFTHVRAPAIPFFPIVLKDFTFYVDGNQTTLNNPLCLVNFSKFRALYKFANSVTSLVNENYTFSGDLEHLAFFPGAQTVFGGGPLDPVAEAVESRLREVRDNTTTICT